MHRPPFAAALAVVVGALVSREAFALTVVVEPAAPVVVGQPQTFRVASVGEAEGEVMLTWMFGDGSTSGPAADRQVTHVYQSAGHYTVIALAADDVGRTSTSFVQTAHHPLTPTAPANSSSIIVDARERRVWNVNPDNDSVSVVDSQTLSLVREVFVGKQPHALAQAPDGTIWVANQRSDEIVVLDRSSGGVEARIPLPYASQPRWKVKPGQIDEALAARARLGTDNAAQERWTLVDRDTNTVRILTHWESADDAERWADGSHGHAVADALAPYLEEPIDRRVLEIAQISTADGEERWTPLAGRATEEAALAVLNFWPIKHGSLDAAGDVQRSQGLPTSAAELWQLLDRTNNEMVVVAITERAEQTKTWPDSERGRQLADNLNEHLRGPLDRQIYSVGQVDRQNP